MLYISPFVSDFPPNININPQDNGYLGLLTNGSSPPDNARHTTVIQETFNELRCKGSQIPGF